MKRPSKYIISIKEKTRVRYLSLDELKYIYCFGPRAFMKARQVIRCTSVITEIKKSTTTVSLKYSIWRVSVADDDLTQQFRSFLSLCTATCKRIWDQKKPVIPYLYHCARRIIAVVYFFKFTE